MTLITTSRDEGSAEARLAQALEHYQGAINALTEAQRAFNAKEESSPDEIRKAAADLRRATQTLFDERKRLEDQHRRDAGIVHDFGFDFDVARAEIGSRLDRLRAARGAGEVPR